jgi:hypothetical protein
VAEASENAVFVVVGLLRWARFTIPESRLTNLLCASPPTLPVPSECTVTAHGKTRFTTTSKLDSPARYPFRAESETLSMIRHSGVTFNQFALCFATYPASTV